MRKVKGIVFDLDGTLIFFKIDYIAARQEVIEKLYSFGIPKELVSVSQRIMQVIKIVEIYLKDEMKTPEKIPLIKNQIDQIITKYEMDGAKKTDLIPGAKELLGYLKRQSFKVGLFTLENRETTEFILEKFSLNSCFDSIVTRDDVDNLKPHPDHLLKVLIELGISPYEIVVVGDNPIDLVCAKQIDAIAIARLSDRHEENDLLKAGADFIVKDLLDIKKILKKLI